MIKNLLKSLSQKSYENQEHIIKISEYADLLGRKIGLKENELIELSLIAKLHDIGEITISKNILIKPDKLTKEEWVKIKNHSKESYNIAKSINEFSFVADKILHHHEHWDGRGYPDGLKGEEIPLLSRIIAIVDAYDVMINERPYKRAVSKKDALKEIKRCAGSQFDPNLVGQFAKLMEKNN